MFAVAVVVNLKMFSALARCTFPHLYLIFIVFWALIVDTTSASLQEYCFERPLTVASVTDSGRFISVSGKTDDSASRNLRLKREAVGKRNCKDG